MGSQTNETKVISDETFNNAHKDALKLLEDLPDSATKVYGAIDLAYLQRHSQVSSPLLTVKLRWFHRIRSIKFAAKLNIN
ncbi:hypothetical protein [Nostoc sp. 'Peltigera malacea cyanobiont' DB3992]|uniref:hypothetical protein n=1 Tax=Nostoc sp. 'Peltigera malacea cyanobiont' DB3992 TaxID=1206980 RepID=UPI000C04ED53|nr:hypothetical protein [Nostoc sp. 'Peltigera malacea cyanobiont' DB3992]PHM05616.1 hypothetical protein CK516_39900 [Nostoc sp. 'Peltigera malacea cyanobiont' DB3992]